MDADVAIIGAGIIGAACADALSARGLRVTVIESDTIGSGATAAGMGHLVLMDDNAAELALTEYSLALWRALTARSDMLCEYSNCGTIWIAADEEEMDAARAKQDTLQSRYIACDMLGARALFAVEPHLRAGLAGGLRVKGDGIVYPPKAARFLIDRASARGARLVQGRAVAIQDDSVILDDGNVLRASIVLVANGTGALSLCPELPIRARKGHLVITDRYPGLVRHQLVELGYVKSAHAGDGDSVASGRDGKRSPAA